MKISTWHVRGAIGALSLVVFGFLLGVGADRLFLAHGHGNAVRAVATTEDHMAMLAFQEVLKLEDHQIEQIHEILMRNQVRVDEAWQSIRVQVSEGVENAHAEIRLLLTDEQQLLFEAWLDRHVRGDPDGDQTIIWSH